MRKVQMPEKLQAAIQQKLQAEQASQQMIFVLQKERQEAERKQIEAKGTADFQKIVAQSLTSQILQIRSIEATEKLAQSPTKLFEPVGREIEIKAITCP